MTSLRRLVGIALTIACLSACSHSNQSSSNEASPSAESAAPAQTTAAAGGGNGASLYATNCESCHGANGQGTPGTFPPVASNPTVTGDPTKVIHIVKYGLSGSITVDGKTYNGMMPAWSPQLADADIASVLTYIRSSWGNKAAPITADQVTAVSK